MDAVSRDGDRAACAVADRIVLRSDVLARRTLQRFREEIVGYQAADDDRLADDLEWVRRNIDALAWGIQDEERVPRELMQAVGDVAARRARQGVSLESLLHQGRLFGETIWEFVVDAACIDSPEEREAALRIAGRLWRYVDEVSTAMGYAYVDEVTDRGLMGRDLLDTLLSGRGEDELGGRLARVLQHKLGDAYVAVLLRGDGVTSEYAPAHRSAARAVLDRLVDSARAQLCPTAASLLVGIRQGDVVALYPISEPGELEAIKRECEALAESLSIGVSIGMSGLHPGRAAIPTAYAEAREAVEVAAGTGIRGRAVVLDDVLVDHMLRASPLARRILRETLRPLEEYDRAHQAQLVRTVRAYLQAGTNTTQSARSLIVHPNTVDYRLRRIHGLCGRDPHVMDDLLILFLALKLSDLSAVASDDA